jgi:dienelactone hydrolase
MSKMTLLAGALVLLLILGGCSAEGLPDGQESSPSAMTTVAAPVLGTEVERECQRPAPTGVAVSEVAVRAGDGVVLRAAVLGSGSRGVAMLHQTNDGLCGWFGYAGYLATQGFHVAVFNRRCTFRSACADGSAAHDFIADVDAVLTTLVDRGATSTALVGASFGGAVAIGSCAVLRVAACVALSPAQFDTYLDGAAKPGDATTANNAIDRVRTPLLVAVAADDPDSPTQEVTDLTGRARRGVVTAVELPAGSGHGWDTVTDPGDPSRPATFSPRVIAFLDQHLGR